MSDDMSLQGESAGQASGSVLCQQQDLGTETLAPQLEVHQESRRLGCVKVGDLRDVGISTAIVLADSDPPKPSRSSQRLSQRLLGRFAPRRPFLWSIGEAARTGVTGHVVWSLSGDLYS